MTLSKTLAVGLCALSLAACENMSDRELTGTVLGGALGGLVGSQVNRHGDQGLSTALGVALGAYVGNRIGHAMDKRDVAEHDRAAQDAMWNARSGRPHAWSGYAASGEVSPMADAYRDPTGRSCRRFSDTVTFRDGYRRTVDGTACLNADGQWVVVG
jgi:surface antigen